MFEVRGNGGQLIGSYITKQEALDRLHLWPDAFYVVQIEELRTLLAVKDGYQKDQQPTPEKTF